MCRLPDVLPCTSWTMMCRLECTCPAVFSLHTIWLPSSVWTSFKDALPALIICLEQSVQTCSGCTFYLHSQRSRFLVYGNDHFRERTGMAFHLLEELMMYSKSIKKVSVTGHWRRSKHGKYHYVSAHRRRLPRA